MTGKEVAWPFQDRFAVSAGRVTCHRGNGDSAPEQCTTCEMGRYTRFKMLCFSNIRPLCP